MCLTDFVLQLQKLDSCTIIPSRFTPCKHNVFYILKFFFVVKKLVSFFTVLDHSLDVAAKILTFCLKKNYSTLILLTVVMSKTMPRKIIVFLFGFLSCSSSYHFERGTYRRILFYLSCTLLA